MSLSVRVPHIAAHIAECQKTDGFYTEFSALLDFDNSLKSDPITHFPTSLQYQKKNRWTDGGFEVYANEKTRIKLPINDAFQHDYINANFIPKSVTKSYCDYIATQAPMNSWIDGLTVKEETMHDFWNMIWHHNVPVIVMLAKLIEEEERIKAHQYWPEVNDERTFESRDNNGNFIVRGIAEYLYDNDPDIIIREMVISQANVQRTVYQVHFIGWPDNSVPTKYDGFLGVLKAADELMKGKSGPMTVHCSAGVGRTGTLICIHSMLHQLVEHYESETTEPFMFDIFGTVFKLKNIRWQLVYNVQQYEFCYRGTLYVANKYWGRSLCTFACNDNNY
jgi:protein tyrosine phosphatase